MKPRKNNWLWIIGALLLIGVLFSASQGFTLYGGVVYTPVFTNIKCADTGQDATAQPTVIDREGEFFRCPFGSFYAVDGCQFYLDATGSGVYMPTSKVQICTSQASSTCGADFFNGALLGGQPISVAYGKYLYVNPDILGTGDFVVSAKANIWGLDVIGDNNFRESTADCTLNSLKYKYSYVESTSLVADSQSEKFTSINGQMTLKPGETLNAVTAVTPTISSRVIVRDDIENGQPIYIPTAGFYNKIVELDGTKYVDTSKTIQSDKIECVPRIGTCTDDATWSTTTPPSCDKLLGNYVGYIPVSANKMCTYECDSSTSTPSPSTNCIDRDFGKCTDPAKPFFDQKSGLCVAGDPAIPPVVTPKDPTVLFIVLGFVVVILAMFALKYKLEQGKGRRR